MNPVGAPANVQFAVGIPNVCEYGDPRLLLELGLAAKASGWEHHGEHDAVRETRFPPMPVQRPRIPVWIAGPWPARPPFRRAARWDGVFPTHRDVGHAETMTPDQLREIVDYTRSHREGDRPFDVVIEGQTAGADPGGDLERVSAYAEAGLSWWVEKMGWFRGSVDATRERIAAGPPRPESS